MNAPKEAPFAVISLIVSIVAMAAIGSIFRGDFLGQLKDLAMVFPTFIFSAVIGIFGGVFVEKKLTGAGTLIGIFIGFFVGVSAILPIAFSIVRNLFE